MIHRQSFIQYVCRTGGTLDPGATLKYQTAMPIPPGTPRAGETDVEGDESIDDHAARLDVDADVAGLGLLRGGPDDEVKDNRTGAQATLPGPAPAHGDPPGAAYFELPIAIQDRFDGVHAPTTDVSPSRSPEVFGDTMLVNGSTWPFQAVEQRRYRLRMLNGCQARFLFLDFGAIPGVKVWQIGNEGGFLVAPVDITTHHHNRVLLGPGERADCIVDFGDVAAGEHLLRNVGPDEPFSGGVPDVDFPAADPSSTGQVLQFRVAAATAADPSTPPQFLRLPGIAVSPVATVTRRLALLEEMSMFLADAVVTEVWGFYTAASEAIVPGAAMAAVRLRAISPVLVRGRRPMRMAAQGGARRWRPAGGRKSVP